MPSRTGTGNVDYVRYMYITACSFGVVYCTVRGLGWETASIFLVNTLLVDSAL